MILYEELPQLTESEANYEYGRCAFCAGPIPKPLNSGRRRFCSNSCCQQSARREANAARLDRWEKNPRHCSICSKRIPLLERPTSLFCGKACRNIHSKRYAAKNSNGVRGRTTSDTGAASEMVACADLLRRQYEVFRAISPSASCDLIAYKDADIIKIQVKTGFVDAKGKLVWPNPKDPTRHHHVAVVNLMDFSVVYIPDIPGYTQVPETN